MGRVTLFILSLIVELVGTVYSADIITSDPDTNWGDWATDFERCPNGTAAQAAETKWHHIDSISDDLAVTGFALVCGDAGYITTPRIRSLEAPQGKWTNFYSPCYDVLGPRDSFVRGFQLRVLKDGFLQDELATNSVRVYCSDGRVAETGGGPYGDWGVVKLCPGDQVVCGLKTQIHNDPGSFVDNTGLNNIAMECCPKPI